MSNDKGLHGALPVEDCEGCHTGVNGAKETDSDHELQIIAEAIQTARRVQDFLWQGCYPPLRPYDREGWRKLFQKRVDCIAEADPSTPDGLANLRKRLLQQAALSVKALALLNRWVKNNADRLKLREGKQE